MTNGIFFGVSGEKIPEGGRVGVVKDSVSYNFNGGYKYVSGSGTQIVLTAQVNDVVTLFVDPSSGVRMLYNNTWFLLSSAALASPCFTLSTYYQNDQVEIV